MTRWLSLVFASLAGATWFTEEEVGDILGDELAKQARDFLRLNFVAEATLKQVKPWLKVSTRWSVGPLASKTYMMGTLPIRDSEFRERGKVRRCVNFLHASPLNEKETRRSTLWELVEIVAPDAGISHEEVVEGILDIESISQALSTSLSNDRKAPLPVDHPEAGEPPLYCKVANPPPYETLFTEQFIESEAKLIHELILFCREANLEEVGALTNGLVSLMFSNWKIKNSAGSYPDNYKCGSAAALSRLARQLEQSLALPAAAH